MVPSVGKMFLGGRGHCFSLALLLISCFKGRVRLLITPETTPTFQCSWLTPFLRSILPTKAVEGLASPAYAENVLCVL